MRHVFKKIREIRAKCKVKTEIIKSFLRRGLRVYRNLLRNDRYICGIKCIPESTPVKSLE